MSLPEFLLLDGDIIVLHQADQRVGANRNQWQPLFGEADRKLFASQRRAEYSLGVWRGAMPAVDHWVADSDV